MMDASHSPDTLFLVAEADFRFFEADDMSPEEWASAVVWENFVERTARPKAQASSSASGSRSNPCGKPEKIPRHSGFGFFATGRKVHEDGLHIPQEIQDTVTICNEADRCRCIWGRVVFR